jgi:TetR/AcrR family transcriptional repressor of nem operon
MGIHKGSFYDTYGSKKEVYLAALDQYMTARFAQFRESAEQQTPKRSLEMHLNEILEDCIGADGHRGCMVINCALELAHSDAAAQKAVRRGFKTHEKFFFERVVAAQEAGEVSSEIDAAATAKAIFAIVIGMRVYSRAGAPKATLRTLADQALALLER